MDYPVRLSKDDNDTVLVEFPDFPEAVTFGETEDEALMRAQDALATAIEAYIKERRPIPAPSAVRGPAVALPALMAAKVSLYGTMLEQRVGKAELGRRLNCHLPQVDRLLNIHHGSQLDQLEAAFKVMGKRLTIGLDDDDIITGASVQRSLRDALRVGRMGKRRVSSSRTHAVSREARAGAFAHKGVHHKAAAARKKR